MVMKSSGGDAQKPKPNKGRATLKQPETNEQWLAF